MTHTHTDPLALLRTDLALHWETLREAYLNEAARHAVACYGGQLIEPRAHWGPLEFELTLLGVQGTGLTVSEAARNWTTRALRMVRHDSDAAIHAA